MSVYKIISLLDDNIQRKLKKVNSAFCEDLHIIMTTINFSNLRIITVKTTLKRPINKTMSGVVVAQYCA